MWQQQYPPLVSHVELVWQGPDVAPLDDEPDDPLVGPEPDTEPPAPDDEPALEELEPGTQLVPWHT
jgi:hypothetical protein